MKRLALTATATAALAAAIGLPAATARPAGPRTIELVEHAAALSAVDLPPVASSATSPPSRGDEIVFTKPLTTPNGHKAGTLHAVCTVTRPRRSIETAVYQCEATYVLRKGRITAQTVAPVGTASRLVLAVTGGTGAYAGARGEVVSKQGETATDTIHLVR
jgi:hypothetical protein